MGEKKTQKVPRRRTHGEKVLRYLQENARRKDDKVSISTLSHICKAHNIPQVIANLRGLGYNIKTKKIYPYENNQDWYGLYYLFDGWYDGIDFIEEWPVLHEEEK